MLTCVLRCVPPGVQGRVGKVSPDSSCPGGTVCCAASEMPCCRHLLCAASEMLCDAADTCSFGSWLGPVAPDAVLPPSLPPDTSNLDPVSPERWQGSPAMMTETHRAAALLHHAYLKLLDHSLYEEGPELHPLQALLGQADGVEDSSRDPVSLLCFRWRALLHDALENTSSTPQKGSLHTTHTESHPATVHKTSLMESEVLQETLDLIPTPKCWWLRLRPCFENSGGDNFTAPPTIGRPHANPGEEWHLWSFQAPLE